MNIITARTLGQVETEIFAGRMDLDQGIDYMIHSCEVDSDDLDTVRHRLRSTAAEAEQKG